jgi:hypothetical protein
MDLLEYSIDDFSKSGDEIILMEKYNNSNDMTERSITEVNSATSRAMTEKKPTDIISTWNMPKSNQIKYNLIGKIKSGDKITYNGKKYQFKGIGEVSNIKGSKTLQSNQLKFTDEKNNNYHLSTENKFLVSAFISNFILNQEDRSLTSLRGNSSRLSEKLKGNEELNKITKEEIYAIDAAMSEKKYPIGKPQTSYHLKNHGINIYNLAETSNTIYTKGISLSEAYGISTNIKRKIKINRPNK